MIDDLNKIKEIINNLEQIISKLKIKLPDIEVDEKVLKFYKVIMSEINLLSEIHEDIVYRAKKSYTYTNYDLNKNPFNGQGAEYIAKNNQKIIVELSNIEKSIAKFIEKVDEGVYESKLEDSMLNIFAIKEMLKDTYGKFGLIDFTLCSNFQSDLDFNEKKIRELSKSYKNLDNEFKELNINYIDFNNKISDSFKKLTSISIEINTLENELSLYKNSINKQLSEFISVEKKYIDDHLVNLLNNLNIKFEEAEVQINNQIEKIENTSKSFNDFISDETSIKLTNNFKEKSESERKWYYGFNMVSGIAIIFAICMSYFSLTEFADDHAKNFTQLDLYYLGIRLLFSFLIFSTVAFTNKLANKHYYHWKKNESTYLKLTALNSFIANMSPEKQQEIHEKLIDVYFGKEDLDPTIYKKYDNTSENILKLFADKLPSIGAETKKGN